MARKSTHPFPPSPALFEPGFWRHTLGEAWNLFIFSCIFGLIFNAFFPDGIELKYKNPKKIYLMDYLAQKATQAKTANGPSAQKYPSAQGSSASPDDVIPRLSLIGAKAKFDKKKSAFLDARKPEEYQAGHIAGAYNFYSEEIDQFAPQVLPLLPDKQQDLVCYCHGGTCDMALQVAHFLIGQGYAHVEIYQGGWPEWSREGYPQSKGATP